MLRSIFEEVDVLLKGKNGNSGRVILLKIILIG